MALIKCSKCGHVVSDKASVCPNCGCPTESVEAIQDEMFEEKPEKSKGWIWALIVALLCLIGGGGYYAYTKLFNDGSDKDAIVKLTPEFIKAVQQYEQLGVFSEGMAAVKKGDKWGYINTKGEEVIPTSIEAKCVGRFSEGLAVVMCGGEDFKIINTAGESLFALKIKNRGYDMTLQESSELPYYINGKLYVPFYDENGNIGFAIYDKKGSEIGTANEKDGFEFYKQNETGNYITFFKEGDSGTQLWGLKDANDNVIIEPQYDAILTMFHSWYGDNNIKTKISNGVALVVMNEVSWDDMGGVSHYGYVDMKGNETLSEATKATCKTSHKIINEVTDEYYDEDEGEVTENYNSSNNYDWLQGTWTIKANFMGQTTLEKLVIDGNYATSYSDGEVVDKGEYDIYDGKITFGSTYAYIDEERQLIKFNDNHYYSHSSQPTTSVNVGTPAQEKELKIMARLRELQEKGKSLVSELYTMQQSGQMDHARYLRLLYIKQTLIQYKDEQIQLSLELGDEQLARKHMQEKDGLLQSIRMLENGY